MYYKVLRNGRVIDVLEHLVFLKYQERYDRMVFCDEDEAQAIFSSDRKHIWHTEGLYNIPVAGYDEVQLIEIDEYEYDQLRIFNMHSPEELIDYYTELLLKENVI